MKQASKQYIPFQPLQWPNPGPGDADAAVGKAADVQDSGGYWL